MKAHTRWLACNPCGVLRDHVLDTTGLTPFEKTPRVETWICSICGAGHPVAPSHSDQADRVRLERLGQLRLFE
ncbi:hypothetical protein [Ralstonia solanacearum]|uniref:hypothetical protein n=1 Tax=Ralstonia solanacearum TaxID=305 RepID=UPI0009B95FAE|nr:hypothetical protein [Ralstonia solanacearum]MDB0543313.1 hypothetical protein [Ralstonia solanacearum]MDB0553477.1 hypothetical protein [Ralstonia solanacearum]